MDFYDEGRIDNTMVSQRMAALGERRDELHALVEEAGDTGVITIHPNAAEYHRAMIERLGEALQGSDATEAWEALRGLLEKVALYPGESKRAYRLRYTAAWRSDVKDTGCREWWARKDGCGDRIWAIPHT